jgi:hypothetical protein
LYCANKNERVEIPLNADKLFDPNNLDSVINELYNCQGEY